MIFINRVIFIICIPNTINLTFVVESLLSIARMAELNAGGCQLSLLLRLRSFVPLIDIVRHEARDTTETLLAIVDGSNVHRPLHFLARAQLCVRAVYKWNARQPGKCLQPR